MYPKQKYLKLWDMYDKVIWNALLLHLKRYMVAYTFNPSEAEAGRLLCVWGQSVLHSEFQDSQYYKVKTYLKLTKIIKIKYKISTIFI